MAISRRAFLQAVGATAVVAPSMVRAIGPEDVLAQKPKTGAQKVPGSGEKPNVILILCDDLGWGDLGEFWQNKRKTEGVPHIDTPHIDTAMREGVMLTNAYTTAPVCVPARASMVTGKNQGHCNVRDEAFDRPIDPHMTIGTVMKAAGYDTWHLGKWGIGGGYQSETDATRCGMACDAGFDYSYGYPAHMHGHSYYHFEGSNNNWEDSALGSPIVENISAEEYGSGTTYTGRYALLSKGAGTTAMAFEPDDEGSYYRRLISNDEVQFCYDVDLFTAKLKQLIDQQLQDKYKDKPFFAYACYTTVHASGNRWDSEINTTDITDGSYSNGKLQAHVPPSGFERSKVSYNNEAKNYFALNSTPATTDAVTGEITNRWGGGVTWEPDENGKLPFKGTATTANRFIHPDYKEFNDDGTATIYNTWGRRRYATMVRRLDDTIGDLRNFLEVRGIAENTLIILTSDNGPAQEQLSSSGINWIEGTKDGFDSNGPYNSYKRSCYEGGMREPTFAVWPGKIGNGKGSTSPKRVNHPFQFPAWMATLADVAGLPQPAHCDGVSLLPVLTGTGVQLPSRIYSEWKNQQMVRDGDYVLYRASVGATPELYRVAVNGEDLVYGANGTVTTVKGAEPYQDTNTDIASDHPEKVAWMSNLLVTCRLSENKLGTTGYGTINSELDAIALPSVAQAGYLPAWEVRVYNDNASSPWPWVPNFRTMYPNRAFLAANMDAVKAELATSGAYGIAIRGWLDVKKTGDVTFTATGAGGCQLWIHEAHALEWEADDCASGKSVTLKLAKGRHPFRLYLTTKDGTAGLCSVTGLS